MYPNILNPSPINVNEEDHAAAELNVPRQDSQM